MSSQPSPVDVLTDVAPQCWDVLARGVRRAVEKLPSAQVPVALRPFATFKPEALRDAPHARRAVAHALVGDARFRDAVAEAVADDELRARVSEIDAVALRAEVGADRALALLAVSEQWDAVATLAAVLADERAARGSAAAVPSAARRADVTAELQSQVRALRREVAEEKRGAADLRRQVRALTSERDAARGEAGQARDARDALAAQLDRERADHRERLARARRKAARARRSAAASDARIAEIVGELGELAARLQMPVRGDEQGLSDAEDAGGADAVPRGVGPATPGRPARLPAGVDPDSSAAVAALLQIPALRVFVDGYNATMDERGVPGLTLEEQRRWLVRLLNGVVARYDVRPTLVFDGRADVGAAVPRARGVLVCFATEGTADELLAELLDGLDDDAPALVVSSDREVRAAAAARRANTVTSGRFLTVVTA